MQTTFNRTLYEAVIVIMLSVGLCVVVTALRPQGLGLFGHSPERSASSDETSASSAISMTEAAQRFTDGSALFADARFIEDYAAGHIKGARSMPLNQFDEWIAEFLATTAQETRIITYCDGADCYLARELAERLAMLGYESVYFLENGWGQWQAQGLPLAKGLDNP